MRLKGKRCQCGGCGEYFSTLRAFDRHRVRSPDGTRWCLSTFGMEALGLCQHQRGDERLWMRGPSTSHASTATPLLSLGNTAVAGRAPESLGASTAA